jgi:hypothetical protein
MPKGRVRCAKSYGHRSVVMALLALGAVTVVTDALAQGVNTAPTEADVREAIGPVISLIVWPLFFVTRVVWFILEHTSAAILLSAVSAGIFAWRTMKTQSATVRLRETFATINRDNWDRDVIAARTTLMRIKSELVKNPGGISKFAHESNPIDAPDQRADPNTVRPPAQEGLNDVPAGPRDRDAEKDKAAKDEAFFEVRTTLQTILNDYENVALGIKHGILDERFLYQWMRAVVISDWVTLSPLVNEYRRIYNNRQIYVEFEGLSEAWSRNRSYRNNGRLNRSRRWLSIR